MGAILVVTSDADTGRTYTDLLVGRGHHVIDTHSALRGVEHLREGGIDAVILDLEVESLLRAMATGISELPDPPPFVLVSQAVTAPELSAKIGAASFVVKPCSEDEISFAVERLLTVYPDEMFDDGPTTRLVQDDVADPYPTSMHIV